uniref:Uncharacterized protein n=1 Tax=Mola mola TaxID=94237 RepID=A0A3Q4BK68_MOLML
MPPTVSSGGQPHHAGDGHHGNAGVMRERRAVGDPYWSYSGELSFLLCNAGFSSFYNFAGFHFFSLLLANICSGLLLIVLLFYLITA